jgi:hypothetical protein
MVYSNKTPHNLRKSDRRRPDRLDVDGDVAHRRLDVPVNQRRLDR